MNGVHDMGGMDGFGKVEVEPNEPPFHEKWEGRVLAMQRSLGYAGAWHIDHGRFAQEALPPRTYLAASYYWRWALGMQKNLIERGFVGQDEIDAGHALAARQGAAAQAHGRCRAGQHDAQLLLPPATGPAPLQAGRPRAHAEHPPAGPHPTAALRARQAGHGRADPRLPRLSRLVAADRGDDPQWLYTVVFDAKEIWGADADPTLKISIDAFEPYLKPA